MPKPMPYFLSYAHDDEADVNRFRDVIRPLLKGSTECAFSEWIDHSILPGLAWREQIDKALAAGSFGILLVTPNFLASSFITKTELPALLAKPMVVPVALHKISFDGTLDLKGLADRQVFHDSKRRTFDACKTKAVRRDFALELYGKIIALVRT